MFYDTVRDKSVYVPYDEDIVAGVGLELRGTICPPYGGSGSGLCAPCIL